MQHTINFKKYKLKRKGQEKKADENPETSDSWLNLSNLEQWLSPLMETL